MRVVAPAQLCALTVMGSVANGFVLPLKEEHVLFFLNTLLPLYRRYLARTVSRTTCTHPLQLQPRALLRAPCLHLPHIHGERRRSLPRRGQVPPALLASFLRRESSGVLVHAEGRCCFVDEHRADGAGLFEGVDDATQGMHGKVGALGRLFSLFILTNRLLSQSIKGHSPSRSPPPLPSHRHSDPSSSP